MHPQLSALGWDPVWEAIRSTLAPDDAEPARVAVQHRGGYILYAADGEAPAAISGRLRHEAHFLSRLPVVGDWVLVRDGVIHAVLPRRTSFSRKVPLGQSEEQVVGANVDAVLVVEAIDGELNTRRLERYLTAAYESGAEPAVLLNKMDLSPDSAAVVSGARAVAPGTPVHALSARTGEGLAALDMYCRPGRTVVFLGPSGVGKTSLLNALSGEERPTASVLEDGRGRHTTTHRELVIVPGRGMILDTPGMRELQLWDASAGLDAVFDDVTTLENGCRFGDCSHGGEPGCAIRAAIAAGTLAAERFASYQKLEREEAHVLRKRDKRALAEQRREWRTIMRARRARWTD